MFSSFLKLASIDAVLLRVLHKRGLNKLPVFSLGKPTWPTRGAMCYSSQKLAEAANEDVCKVESEHHDKRTLFIRDFRSDTMKSSLEAAFGTYGAVQDVSVIRTASGKSKGFGYVTYENADSAARALAGTHCIDNKWIIAERKMPTNNLAGRSKKVIVQNVPEDFTQEDIKSHFSRFGNVECLDFVITDPTTKARKDYCFVGFTWESDAAKAVEAESHVINDCLVQVRFSTSKFSSLPHTKEIIVRSLANDITVDVVKDYFAAHGKLARVDLICNRHPKNSNTFAFVKFENPEVADRVSELDVHLISDKEAVVKKTALRYPMKRRHLKVFVEGLPTNCDPKEVQKYFQKFGDVTALKKSQLSEQGNTTVVFRSYSGVKNVIAQQEHVLKGQSLTVRQLSWITEELSLFDLANKLHFKDRRRRK